ncbi:hypothetical protein AB0E01_44675 [Nocardia vinacea]|uniref:hypothetical protein n=1 Tax=Nocardia vinacea TaxID=96468 RepID=UPI0033DA9711
MLVLAAGAVWAGASAELDFAFVEVFLEAIPFLSCRLTVFVSWPHPPPVLEVSLVVHDDILIEYRHVAAESFEAEVTEQGCADMNRKPAVGEICSRTVR